MAEQITITRALAKVKSITQRLERGATLSYITTATGGKTAGGRASQETSALLKANYQSTFDLLKERAALKGAIVRSNAVTEVVVGTVTMTVAEAIERKASIQHERTLLAVLKQQLAQATAQVERNNTQMQARLDQLIATAVGKDRKVEAAELAAITDPFTKQNITELVDPVGLQNEIEALERHINEFDLNVDFALSEVNAITKITV